MGIILLESSDSGKTAEGTREFVSVEDTKVSVSQRELLVGSEDGIEHDTMARAVHWLQSKLLFFDLEYKHVALVLEPMAGGLPEMSVVHIRSNDLVISSNNVFMSDKLLQFVVDNSTVWVHESRTGTQLTEEEEFLLKTNISVISLFNFFL